MTAAPDRRKRSCTFPPEMLAEIRKAAAERGVSVSKLLQEAWERARDRIAAIPAPRS